MRDLYGGLEGWKSRGNMIPWTQWQAGLQSIDSLSSDPFSSPASLTGQGPKEEWLVQGCTALGDRV